MVGLERLMDHGYCGKSRGSIRDRAVALSRIASGRVKLKADEAENLSSSKCLLPQTSTSHVKLHKRFGRKRVRAVFYFRSLAITIDPTASSMPNACLGFALIVVLQASIIIVHLVSGCRVHDLPLPWHAMVDLRIPL